MTNGKASGPTCRHGVICGQWTTCYDCEQELRDTQISPALAATRETRGTVPSIQDLIDFADNTAAEFDAHDLPQSSEEWEKFKRMLRVAAEKCKPRVSQPVAPPPQKCEGCEKGLPVSENSYIGKYHYTAEDCGCDIHSSQKYQGRCTAEPVAPAKEPDRR